MIVVFLSWLLGLCKLPGTCREAQGRLDSCGLKSDNNEAISGTPDDRLHRIMRRCSSAGKVLRVKLEERAAETSLRREGRRRPVSSPGPSSSWRNRFVPSSRVEVGWPSAERSRRKPSGMLTRVSYEGSVKRIVNELRMPPLEDVHLWPFVTARLLRPTPAPDKVAFPGRAIGGVRTKRHPA